MPEVCSHNISLADSCSAWVQESMALQPVWKMVPDLMKNSKYQREGQGPECTGQRDGKKEEIAMVPSTDEKTVREVQELMEQTSRKAEADAMRVLTQPID